MEKAISIIIIEYFCLSDVDNCISLYMNRYSNLNLEFIVSSNSQYDLNEQLELREKYKDKDVLWIFNLKNGGFAYAMNCGAKLAHSPILIFTNPDVQIGDRLKEMYSFILSHSDVGIVAPRIIDEFGELQDSCRCYLSVGNFVIRHIRRGVRKDAVVLTKGINYSQNQSVDWVIGAFMMVKRDVFELVGGFDDCYFLYCEDADLCARIKESGYHIIYYSATTAIYKGTRSARKSYKYFKVFVKSLFRYWNKNGYFKRSIKSER